MIFSNSSVSYHLYISMLNPVTTSIKCKKSAASSWYLFYRLFFMFAWDGQFLMKGFQAFLSLIRSLLTSNSFWRLLILLFHIFLGPSLGKVPLTLKVQHILDQSCSSILSRWPNHYILLSCKHTSLFNFNLFLSSSVEVLSSSLTVHIYLTFLHRLSLLWPHLPR